MYRKTICEECGMEYKENILNEGARVCSRNCLKNQIRKDEQSFIKEFLVLGIIFPPFLILALIMFIYREKK